MEVLGANSIGGPFGREQIRSSNMRSFSSNRGPSGHTKETEGLSELRSLRPLSSFLKTATGKVCNFLKLRGSSKGDT